MITEVETLYTRIEMMRMTPAERELARARLEQAEAFAEAVHAAVTGLRKLVPHRPHHGGTHHSGLRPSA